MKGSSDALDVSPRLRQRESEVALHLDAARLRIGLQHGRAPGRVRHAFKGTASPIRVQGRVGSQIAKPCVPRKLGRATKQGASSSLKLVVGAK